MTFTKHTQIQYYHANVCQQKKARKKYLKKHRHPDIKERQRSWLRYALGLQAYCQSPKIKENFFKFLSESKTVMDARGAFFEYRDSQKKIAMAFKNYKNIKQA